jgi:hypothetical protein
VNDLFFGASFLLSFLTIYIVGVVLLRLSSRLQIVIMRFYAGAILVVHAIRGLIIRRSGSIQGIINQNIVPAKETEAEIDLGFFEAVVVKTVLLDFTVRTVVYVLCEDSFSSSLSDKKS